MVKQKYIIYNRPIISYIEATTYEIAKHLKKLVMPLNKSE